MADPCQAAQVVANPALNMVNMFEHTVHVVLADLGARGQMMACRRFANAGSHPAKAPTRAATSAIFCVWEMIRHWQTLTKRCCKTMLVRPTIHGHFRVRQCRHPAACRGSVHHRAAFTIVQRSPSCSVHRLSDTTCNIVAFAGTHARETTKGIESLPC